MDYWRELEVTLHDSYSAFAQTFSASYEAKRVFALTTKGQKHYSDIKYQIGDVFLFGPESRGLPESIRREVHQLRIPMTPQTRSLNIAVSAAVVVYEAWRQLGYA
jgi:tRNA (cytidine/uridine-2'-O-)-methyltransferase